MIIAKLDAVIEELENNFDYIGDIETIERWIADDSSFVEFLSFSSPPSRLDQYDDLKRDFSRCLEIERSSRGQVIEPIHNALRELTSFLHLTRLNILSNQVKFVG